MVGSPNEKGLALDIDGTLADSVRYYFTKTYQHFGPKDKTVEELMIEYDSTWLVPEWQNDEIQFWIKQTIVSNEIQERFDVINNAHKYVQQINDIIPVAAYVSARPENVRAGTKKWLDHYGFPEAEIVLRPDKVNDKDSIEWKTGVLKKMYPHILGIVDDSIALIDELNGYQGTLFLYGHSMLPTTDLDTLACPNWEHVYQEVKKKFKTEQPTSLLERLSPAD